MRSMKRFGYHAVHILFASFINKFLVCRFPSIFHALLFCIQYSVIAEERRTKSYSPWLIVAHGSWLTAHETDYECLIANVLKCQYSWVIISNLTSLPFFCVLRSRYTDDPFKLTFVDAHYYYHL